MKIGIPLSAILCIAVLEATALVQGIDGALLSASFAAIGGIAGFYFKTILRKKE